MAHKHTVYDADPHFSIDPVTRSIQNKSGKVVIMQYDHNSECLTFDMPKTIDGHDMSLCNLVQVHYNNEGSSAKEEYSGVEEIKDFHVNPNNQDQIVFSWLISGNATLYAGTLSFSVSFQCTSNGDIDYEWGTDTYEELSIRKRPRNSDKVAHRMPDILTTWRNELFTTSNTEEGNILTVSQAQQAAIAKQGEIVLTRIGETDIYNRAGAIVCEAEGETIVVNDSSDDHIRGLKLLGKSTQDGTPTPENPVEIVSVEPTVGVYGKNLITGFVDSTKTANGVSFTVNADNSITVNGTATEAALFNMITAYEVTPVIRPGATYTISGATSVAAIQVYEWQDKWVQSASTSGEKTFTLSENTKGLLVRYVVNPGMTADNLTVYPMLRLTSDVDNTYELGKAAQTLKLTHTLRGIPVTSGGNYTDSDGQQWVCDEIDFERGVYVQRTKLKTLYDRTNWLTWGADAETEGLIGFYTYCEDLFERTCLSNAFPYAFYGWGGHEYGAGAYAKAGSSYIIITVRTSDLDDVSSDEAAINSFINFISKTNANVLVSILPIETPLTAEELAAFKALRTNYHNTTILSDAGAWLSVRYNADTKLYIDNKITSAIDAYLTEHLNG